MRMRSSDSSDNGEDETVSSDVSSLTALEHYVFLHGLGDSILILGGGNLTFAWSLAHLHPEKKILATVPESREEFLDKYCRIKKTNKEKREPNKLIQVEGRVKITKKKRRRSSAQPKEESGPESSKQVELASPAEEKVNFESEQWGLLNRIELGQEASNLIIRFEVDPTNLEIQEDLVHSKFTDIIMNFPLQANGGAAASLKKARGYLESIFRSVSRHVMLTEHTRFHLTLILGQSELRPSMVKKCNNQMISVERPKFNMASWQPITQAAAFCLRVEGVELFPCALFKDYKYTLKMRGDGSIPLQHSIAPASSHTITFVKYYDLHNLQMSRRNRRNLFHLDFVKSLEAEKENGRVFFLDFFLFEKSTESFAVYHLYRPTFDFELSVSYADEKIPLPDDCETTADKQLEERREIREEWLYKLVFHLAGPLVIKFMELPERRQSYKTTENRVYLLRWQGWVVPLFKLLAEKLFKDLCGRMKDAFKSADAGMMLTCDIIGADRKNCKI